MNIRAMNASWSMLGAADTEPSFASASSDSPFGPCFSAVDVQTWSGQDFCITFLGLVPAPSACISSGRRRAFRGDAQTTGISDPPVGVRGPRFAPAGFEVPSGSVGGCNVIGALVPPLRTFAPVPPAWA